MSWNPVDPTSFAAKLPYGSRRISKPAAAARTWKKKVVSSIHHRADTLFLATLNEIFQHRF